MKYANIANSCFSCPWKYICHESRAAPDSSKVIPLIHKVLQLRHHVCSPKRNAVERISVLQDKYGRNSSTIPWPSTSILAYPDTLQLYIYVLGECVGRILSCACRFKTLLVPFSFLRWEYVASSVMSVGMTAVRSLMVTVYPPKSPSREECCPLEHGLCIISP